VADILCSTQVDIQKMPSVRTLRGSLRCHGGRASGTLSYTAI
jgi:hypothetical protein